MTMKAGLGPCPVSVANLAYIQEKALERSILNEFLADGADMGVTITNLENLLAHLTKGEGKLSTSTLFNVRRALVSLNNLTNVMEEFVV